MQKLTSIINTKLYKPPITTEHVLRARLIKIIESNIYKPLTFICAPAGYGKSMLMSSTLDKIGKPFAWYSLDKDDNNLRLFLIYLTTAIQKKFPNRLNELSELINAAELAPLDILSKTLINNLDEIEEEFIVVLDDYHLISDENVHAIISLIIKYPPQNMHLALLSRRDPPLNLISLKSRSRLNEIRMSELSFSALEIKKLYKNLLNMELDKITTKNLLHRTEGWVTGLRLAAYSVNTMEGFETSLKKMKSNFSLVTEYLVEEVLSKQPEDFQNYLIKTSLLDRFCAELTEALYIPEMKNEIKMSGTVFIEWLEKTNLFLIPLDDESKWFRYHHEFQALLKMQLQKRRNVEQIAKIHKRAGEWFEEEGLLEESLQHYVEAKDFTSVVKLVERNRHQLMINEQWYTLRKMMEMIPIEYISSNPLMLTTQAFIYYYFGRIEECFALIAELDILIPKIELNSDVYNNTIAEFNSLKAEYYIIKSDGKNAQISAKKALELLPREAQSMKSFSIYWLAYSYQMTNDSPAGIKIIKEALANINEFSPSERSRLYLALCGIYFMDGNLDECKKVAHLCIKIGERNNSYEAINIANYFLSSVHYHKNELEDANKYNLKVYTNRYLTRSNYVVFCSIIQAKIEASKGHFEKAWERISTIIDFIKETGDTSGFETITSFRLELALFQGNLKLARELYNHVNFEFPPLWIIYHRQLTEVKAMLAVNEIDKAHQKLNKLIEFGRSKNNVNFLICTLALQAVLFWEHGKKDAAFNILAESLSLAESGGYIQTYLELGTPMNDLLKELRKKKETNDYLESILNAFKDKYLEKEQNQITHSKEQKHSSRESLMVDSLSQRENEILILVAEGLRNKEIAETLFLSPLTIKKHIYNIFQKLNVKSRIYAVEKAKELKILSLN